MKQKINILILIMLFILGSCENSSQKKQNLKKIENEDILIEDYTVSEITSIHQFIDITNKRWNKTERILEANDNSIDSIYIKQDSLFLQKTQRKSIIYELDSIKFGYKIILLDPKD